MKFFKRAAESRMIVCPSCSQLVPVDALRCDMCGADLREMADERRQSATFATGTPGSRGNPYER